MTIAASGKSSSSKAVRDKISYSPSSRSVTVGFAVCFSGTPLQWKRRSQNYHGHPVSNPKYRAICRPNARAISMLMLFPRRTPVSCFPVVTVTVALVVVVVVVLANFEQVDLWNEYRGSVGRGEDGEIRDSLEF